MDGWQQGVISSRERYVIVDASRQSGKSSTFAIKAAHVVIGKPNSLVLIIAEQRQSNEDIRKVRQIVKSYDRVLQKKHDGKITLDMVVDNKTSFELAHGGRCISLPGNEKVRGYSAPDLVIVDEGGSVDDIVFAAIDPMIEVNPSAQLMIGGTPNGTRGFYFNEWGSPRYGELGSRSWADPRKIDPKLLWPYNSQKFWIPWQMCPRISAESIEQKRMIYGDAYVLQEYEGVFLDDTTSLISEAALRQSMDDTEEPFNKEMEDIQNVISGDVELI